jgi:hypothetical protein
MSQVFNENPFKKLPYPVDIQSYLFDALNERRYDTVLWHMEMMDSTNFDMYVYKRIINYIINYYIDKIPIDIINITTPMLIDMDFTNYANYTKQIRKICNGPYDIEY